MHTTASRRSDMAAVAILPAADFVLGEWLVEPDLNQVSRHGVSAHVRPQLMDLLVYLASNTGRTVPHGELLAHVWPDQPFVTGTALPRCIAELRQTLGDRASGSTLIQTIPKRGYRMIAAVAPAPDVAPEIKPAVTPAARPAARPAANRRSEPEGPPPPHCPEPAAAPPPNEAAPASSPTTAEACEDQPPERQLLAWLLGARQLVARVLRPFRIRAS